MTPTAISTAASPVVIVGAGLAGWTTAREFRKLDTTTPLVLVTADGGDFYAKPSLSNAFAQRRSPAQLVTTAAQVMADKLGLTLMTRTRVQAIDVAGRTLQTDRGPLAWGRLVLATGALPIRVPVAGDAAETVQSVNSLDDFAAFHPLLVDVDGTVRPARHVVIMGAGLIGCEFANDLAASGVRVTVVDPAPRPLAALLPLQASAQLQQALADLGVQWQLGTTVASVDRRDRDDHLAHEAATDAAAAPAAPLSVQLANGQTLSADAVLSAIGLRADTTLARAAGMVCERGIVVDATLSTSAAGVYALGDNAQYADGAWSASAPAGGRSLPYVMPIMQAARTLAAHLAGQDVRLQFPLMPVAIKTPALPLVAAPPAPAMAGGWQAAGDGIWHWLDDAGALRGFTLAGAATGQKAKLALSVQI